MLTVMSSVVTVSHWLMSVGFGSVLKKKPRFWSASVFLTNVKISCRTSGDNAHARRACLSCTSSLTAGQSDACIRRLLNANYMGGRVTAHC